MWLLAGAGAICAGLFLALRELLPWMKARRTGVIRLKNVRGDRVERAIDPARFRTLTDQRFKAAGPGILVMLGGLGWLAFNGLGLLIS